MPPTTTIANTDTLVPTSHQPTTRGTAASTADAAVVDAAAAKASPAPGADRVDLCLMHSLLNVGGCMSPRRAMVLLSDGPQEELAARIGATERGTTRTAAPSVP